MYWEREWFVVLWEMLVSFCFYIQFIFPVNLNVLWVNVFLTFNYCKLSMNMFLYVKLRNVFPSPEENILDRSVNLLICSMISSFYFCSVLNHQSHLLLKHIAV